MRNYFPTICQGLACAWALWFAAPAQAQQVFYFRVQSGTGFFVNREYVITNAHVVKGCTKVDLSGGVTQRDAEVVATDEERDLALIRSQAQPTQFAPLRMDIDSLQPGDEVIIIGYPGAEGMQDRYTVARAKVEKLELNQIGNPWNFYISNVVQHGNSGGPVLDGAGNVIGVVVGMMRLDTMNTLTQEKISEERLGAAISLRALQRFVEDHGVYVQWAGSGLLTYMDSSLEDNIKTYTVHVQCKLGADGLPPAGNYSETLQEISQ